MKNQTLRVLKLNPKGNGVVKKIVFFPKVFGRIREVMVAPTGDVYLSTSNRDWHPQIVKEQYNRDYPREFDDRIIKLSMANQNTSRFISQMDTSAVPFFEEVPFYRMTRLLKSPLMFTGNLAVSQGQSKQRR